MHNIDELNEVVRPGLGAKIFRKSILTEDMFYESTIFEDLYTTYIYLDKCSNFSIQLNVIILYIMILIHRHCPQNLLQNLLQNH